MLVALLLTPQRLHAHVAQDDDQLHLLAQTEILLLLLAGLIFYYHPIRSKLNFIVAQCSHHSHASTDL